jgi:hypothetical protein
MLVLGSVLKSESETELGRAMKQPDNVGRGAATPIRVRRRKECGRRPCPGQNRCSKDRH